MGHTVRHKAKLLARVRRIRGQVEALERAIDQEKGCDEVLHQIAAVRGAVGGLMSEVLEDHVRGHVFAGAPLDAAARAREADDLVAILRSYLK